jgi:hypothetical protein
MERDPILEAAFPNLAARGYTITSPTATSYNCIAWAIGDTKRWWWHTSRGGGSYWPPGVPNEGSLDSYVRLFESHGYESCEDSEPQQEFEKVAIYLSYDGRVTHAARQNRSGSWTSKLGRGQDIEHGTLDALDGPAYGQAVKFLKRPFPTTTVKKGSMKRKK